MTVLSENERANNAQNPWPDLRGGGGQSYFGSDKAATNSFRRPASPATGLLGLITVHANVDRAGRHGARQKRRRRRLER